MTQESCLGWALLSGHELVSLCAHCSSSAPVAPPHPLHPTPTCPPVACCLPGWACSHPHPPNDWPLSCLLQGHELSSCPTPPAFVPSLFFPVLGMACNSSPQSRSPSHQVCSLNLPPGGAEGPDIYKNPSCGSEKRASGQDRVSPEGVGGGSAQPSPPGHMESWTLALTKTRPRSAPDS